MHHSIFEVKGIRNTKTGQTVNFNDAVDSGIISLSSQRVVDTASGESFLLSDAAETGIIDPMLHQILCADIGIKDEHGNILNIFQAISRGTVDPRKAVFVDERYNQELSPKDAYEAGRLSLKGAMQLSAYFDINPSLITPDKPAKLGTKGLEGLVAHLLMLMTKSK